MGHKTIYHVYFINSTKDNLQKIFNDYNYKINKDSDSIVCPWPLTPVVMSVIKRNTGIVWVDFYSICGVPRCISDYHLLATQLDVVIIENTPKFLANNLDLLTNFIGLIDVLYSHKVVLVVSACVAINDLCTAGALAVKFQRTKSRLIEMTN